MNPPHERAWPVRLLTRFVTLWYLKALGTTAFMVLFFQAYFWVLKHPIAEPTMMPELAPDHWTPFVPEAFWAYISLWFYVSLPPALLPDFRQLLRYGVWVSTLCLFCLGLFWVLPTQTPLSEIDWSLHPRLEFLKGLDASGNACPSLHVGSSVFSALWLQRIFTQTGAPSWLRWLSVLHCVVIVWSTMAIRQHVFLDVLAGALVGWAFAWLSLRKASTALDR